MLSKTKSSEEKSPALKVNAWRRLRLAACIALAVHAAAGLAMFFILRQGLDTADFASRLLFLTEHRSLWVAAWLCWNLAALSILYFYASFVHAHDGGQSTQSLLRFALLVSVAAVAADLTAESLEMGVLPDLAQKILAHVHSGGAHSIAAAVDVASWGCDTFLAFHRAAVMITGYVANGLYTLSAALLVVATRREYSAWVLSAGALVVVSGACLSCACIANSVAVMVVSNVVLLPALVLWLAGVAATCQTRMSECDQPQSL